jgi:uncharacterized membrane protein YdjX (TVP38/TMEM64 family)
MSVRLFVGLIVLIMLVVVGAAFLLEGRRLMVVLCCCIVGIGAVRVVDVWLPYWRNKRNSHG